MHCGHRMFCLQQGIQAQYNDGTQVPQDIAPVCEQLGGAHLDDSSCLLCAFW